VYAPGPGPPIASFELKRDAVPKEKFDEDLFFELIWRPKESRRRYPAGPGDTTVELSPSTQLAFEEWRTPKDRIGIDLVYDVTCFPTLDRLL